MSARHSSRAKLLGSLLLAAAIFAFLFRRVDVAGVRTETPSGRPGPGDRLGAGLPGPHLAAAGPPGAATYLGWRWREHRRAAAGTAAAPAVPVDQHPPSV